MTNCKVCGIDTADEEVVCISCIEFFKMKYPGKYKYKIQLYLDHLEEFSTKLWEDKK
jgi:hypothetical protein